TVEGNSLEGSGVENYGAESTAYLQKMARGYLHDAEGRRLTLSDVYERVGAAVPKPSVNKIVALEFLLHGNPSQEMAQRLERSDLDLVSGMLKEAGVSFKDAANFEKIISELYTRTIQAPARGSVR